MGGIFYGLLLIIGGLGTALAFGLAFVHWAVDRHPYLDAGGWTMAATGLAALAACSIIDRDVAAYTIVLVAAAVLAAFVAGRRTCGPLLLLVPHEGDDPT